jgi:acyl carrier protein
MDIKKQVKEFFIDNFMAEMDVISDTDSFLENGIIDSTGVLELVLFLEETYNIKVEDDEIIPENLDSLENIAAYVTSKN